MSTRFAGRLAAAATALTLGLLSGCGGGPGAATAAQTPPLPAARDLASYDAYVVASAENNHLFGDVYAIRFQPFAIDRITTGKRISSLGADGRDVLVAAGDANIDRLAVVGGTGDLLPVPGLDRPHAFQPTVVNGVMYYTDTDEVDRKDENRYFAYDLRKQTKTLLFRTEKTEFGLTPTHNGRLLTTTSSEDGPIKVVIRGKAGKKLRSFELGPDAGGGEFGRDWFAYTLVGADERGEDKVVGSALLDFDTGKIKRLPGVQPVAWSPDGTRLLAKRIGSAPEGSPTDTALVLLDPAKPDTPVDVHIVPGLAIYFGTWVRGDALPAR
ncbi:MAG: hypothetical protein ACT4QG_00760 [Sporichthyaceae bacterium]